jgi:hypothetical protein
VLAPEHIKKLTIAHLQQHDKHTNNNTGAAW